MQNTEWVVEVFVAGAEDGGRGLWAALKSSFAGREEEEGVVPEPPDYLPYGVVFVTEAFRVASLNRAAVALLQVDGEAVVGQPIAEWIPNADTLSTRRPSRRHGTMAMFELELQRPDGSLVPVEVSAAPVAGTPLVALTIADLTDRAKRLRRLSRANERLAEARDDAIELSRAKTLTMARVAEVLRTPLSAIIGYAELLVEEAQDRGESEMLSDVQRILDSSGALLSILKNVLDLAEIEAGRMGVLQNRLDIGAELESAIDRHRQTARQRGNRLSLMRTAQVGEAFADRERVEQVLDNLLDNANRYCEGATISVQVLRAPVGDEEHIVVQVADTGPGIPDDKLEGLFVQYGRSGTARGATGAGIGLVVSAALAKLMGGSLTATSRVGVGSTFVLTLPAFTVQHEIHPPMMTATGLPAPRRVSQAAVRLSVRDDRLRLAATAALERGGWPVEAVPHSLEAWADRGGDTLVVIDEGDDFALLERLSAKGGPRMPVVLLLPEAPDEGSRRALDKLTAAICVVAPDAGRREWDEVLHGAVTRAVMMGAMRRRLGPPRPSIVPSSDG